MDVQKILQSRGLKLTKSRQAIVSVFEHQKKPLSAKEIFDALGQVYNKVTIYRNIYALEDLGLLTVGRNTGNLQAYFAWQSPSFHPARPSPVFS